MEVPASLKSIKPFLEQGKLRAESDPTLSYYCNLHALQEAMTLRAKMPKAEQPMAFIMGLMDKVEAQKAALPEVDSPQMHVRSRLLITRSHARSPSRLLSLRWHTLLGLTGRECCK